MTYKVAAYLRLSKEEYSNEKESNSLIVKKQNGEFVGKLAPYGYIKDKHKFLIDKNVSHIIRKIFDMILDGESRRQVK